MTHIPTPDNRKTSVAKNPLTETVLNNPYQEMAEHYGTAILLALQSQGQGLGGSSVGVASTIFGSQYGTSEWRHENLYDPTLADTICDCIIYNATPFRSRENPSERRKVFSMCE